MKWQIRSILGILLCLLFFTGCRKDATDLGGVPVTPEMLESVSLSLEQATATTALVTQTEQAESDLVYWTDGGEVYHTQNTCGALKHATQIHSGSVKDALAVKKERACKSCS